MNLSRPLPLEFDENAVKQQAEVIPLVDTSLDQALENLNRITGLQFASYPQSLVNNKHGEQ